MNNVYNYFYFGSIQFVSNLTRNPRNPQIYLSSESTSRWRWNFHAALRVESTEWHMFHCACLAGCPFICFTLIAQYSLRYSDAHRKQLSVFTTWDGMLSYLQAQPMLDEFVAFAEGKGLKRRYNNIMKSRKLIERAIYANVIYDILGMLEHVKYVNTFDPTVLKAVEVLEAEKAFPVAPVVR